MPQLHCAGWLELLDFTVGPRRIGRLRRRRRGRGFGLTVTRWVTAVAVGVGARQRRRPTRLAVEAVNVRLDASAIDLTAATERLKTEGDRIQGVDRARHRRHRAPHRGARARGQYQLGGVRAHQHSDEQIDRLIVVPHYRMVGSGLIWPDLGISRVVGYTPSSGDRPVRQESTTSDIFRVTLDPGTVITFVAELRTDKLPQIYLWEPDAYKDKVNSLTLYQGIVIGIAGLLALFLTILFVVKGSVMFRPPPRSAGRCSSTSASISDSGARCSTCRPAPSASGVPAAKRSCRRPLLVFLFAYLNLSRWHVRYAHITIAWLAALAALIAVAVFDPAVAAGIARISLLGIAVCGLALVIYLSTHGFDRAVLLIPTWLLAGGVDAGRRHGGDRHGHQRHHRPGTARRPGADRDADRIHRDAARLRRRHHPRPSVSDVERRALALTGAGDMIWDWDVSADKVFTSPETEHMLGLKRGALEGPAAQWLDVLHPLDRDRFPRLARQRGGAAARPPHAGFPATRGRRPLSLVHAEARPVVGSDGEVVRPGRHADRRHRLQARRGTAAVRRGARQSHRPA